MKRHTIVFTGLLVAVSLLAGAVGPGRGVTPVAAQEGGGDDANPLLAMLALVPQSAAEVDDSGALVYYGDIAAWHDATGIPRIEDVALLDVLPEVPRAWWMFVMPRQTVPPRSLGMEYLFSDDLDAVYGFDLLDVDRFVATDAPPENITVAQTGLSPARIGDALLATGYKAEGIENGTFYRILDDYEVALDSDLPQVGMLGALNRIAVLAGGTIVIARASDLVQGVLDAAQGDVPSLADDDRFRAAADALAEMSRSDMGPLVGAIFHQGMIAPDPVAVLGVRAPAEVVEEFEASLEGQGWPLLPPYELTAFGTYRGDGATFLALAVVFPPGVDASAAAESLRARMVNYVSLVTREPLSARWTFDRAFGDDAGAQPVAVVVMRVDDPPVVEGERVNTAILSWGDLIFRLDLGFLVPGGGADEGE